MAGAHNIEVIGADIVLAKLSAVAEDVGSNLNKVLAAIGDDIVEEIKSNAPVAKDSHTPPGHEPGTLRDKGIGWSRAESVGSADAAINIGFTRIGWYGIFYEFGTVHQTARPFVLPAIDRKNNELIDKMGSEVWNIVDFYLEY